MLTYGWIMPDGTKVQNISSSAHPEIVGKFLTGLQAENPELHVELKKMFEKFELLYKEKNAFDDFAIIVLGWIKVGAYKQKIVTYAGYPFQEKYVIPYHISGYLLDNLQLFDDSSRKMLHFIPIKCNYEKAILNGTYTK